MSEEIKYETKRIDHLGIVAGVCHEIDLIPQVDAALGPWERKVSCGHAVQAMVLNALGFSGRALYLMPDYLANKPVELLIGDGLNAEDFNDDSLGRTLDDLYEAGVTEVFARVAAHAVRVYGIEVRFAHLDTSSFHVHGEYEAGEPQAIEIVRGYSKEHRPDLKQVVLSLITAQHSALPVWLEVSSGNSSDQKSFPASVLAYTRQFAEGEAPYFVMDSAGYSQANLVELGKTRWLMRVPETLSEAKQYIEEINQAEMQPLQPGYWGKEVSSEYGGVAQRWLVVYSQAAYEREAHSLEKRRAKELERAERAWRKRARTAFSCEADAYKAQQEFNQQWRYHQVAGEVEAVTRYAGPGRPSQQDQPEVIGYQLAGEIQVDPQRWQEAHRKLGRFIIATNQLKADRLSAEEMLMHYTGQGISV